MRYEYGEARKHLKAGEPIAMIREVRPKGKPRYTRMLVLDVNGGLRAVSLDVHPHVPLAAIVGNPRCSLEWDAVGHNYHDIVAKTWRVAEAVLSVKEGANNEKI